MAYKDKLIPLNSKVTWQALVDFGRSYETRVGVVEAWQTTNTVHKNPETGTYYTNSHFTYLIWLGPNEDGYGSICNVDVDDPGLEVIE